MKLTQFAATTRLVSTPLRTALMRVVRYSHVISEDLYFNLRETAKGLRLVFETEKATMVLAEQTDLVLSVILHMCQFNYGYKLCPTEINSGEFQDVILNLVINARDAMPEGGNLLIETSNKYLDADYSALNPEIKAGDYIQLMMSDTGIGMDRKTLEHIFEPFFTTKPEGKGTGLGMAMVYGFIKRYGGYIKIYSEPGVGSTVRLYLPRSTTTESVIMVNNNRQGELPTGSETILLVDDEVDLLQLAELYLTDLGYRTCTAENASQALKILAEDKEINLLFSDVVMPGRMNGYELAELATQKHTGLKVLLTSGFTSKTMTQKGLERFAVHLLNKPYRKTDLAQRIRQVLDDTTG